MDRFRELSTFVAVAEEGAFNAAARRLNLTPPAVTRLVTALETRIGVRLLTRTTRKVALTEAGERLTARVAQDLADDLVPEGEGWLWNQTMLRPRTRTRRISTPTAPVAPTMAMFWTFMMPAKYRIARQASWDPMTPIAENCSYRPQAGLGRFHSPAHLHAPLPR